MPQDCGKGPSLCVKQASGHACAHVLEQLPVLHPAILGQDMGHQFILSSWPGGSAALLVQQHNPMHSVLYGVPAPSHHPCNPSPEGTWLSIRRKQELEIKRPSFFFCSQLLSAAVVTVER